MALRGYVGRAIKLLVISLVAAMPEVAVAANTIRPPLGNPYGKPRVDFNNLPTPRSIDDCDFAWDRVLTTLGGTKIHEDLCLRAMASPYQENFDAAVNDAANAMFRSEDISDIMRAWPTEVRKEIHDKALALAKQWGADIGSEMPPRNPSQQKSKGEKFMDKPYHMAVIGRKELPPKIEAPIDAQPGQNTLFKTHRP